MTDVIDALDAQSILSYYCQTLIGNQPLWAEFREFSYRDMTGEKIDAQTDSPYTRKGMYLEIGCAQGAPGETVEIPVYISGVNDLSGFQLYLQAEDGLILSDITTDINLEYIKEKMVYDPDELNAYIARHDEVAESIYSTLMSEYENEIGNYASFHDFLLNNEFVESFLGKFPDDLPEGTTFEDYKDAIISAYAFIPSLQKYSAGLFWVCRMHMNPCNGLVIAKYYYTIPEDAESGATYRISLGQDPDLVSKFIPCEPLYEDGAGYHWEYTLLDGVVVVE